MAQSNINLPTDPAQRLLALQQLQLQVESHAAGLDLLLRLIRAVPAAPHLSSIFANVDDAPAPPDVPSAQLAAAWATTTALHLRLVAQIIHTLDAQQLGLQALADEHAAAQDTSVPEGPIGGVLIQELEVDEGPADNLPKEAVLVAALYGHDARLQRPWATDQVAAAAQSVLLTLAAKLSPLLASQQQQQKQQHDADEPLLREVATSHYGDSGSSQPADVQQLLVLALPATLQQLRPVFAAKVDHERHKTARLEPYTGPGGFERCVAAGQLAWLVRQLSGRHLSTATSAHLTAVLAAIEDSFPHEQACGLWALEHMAAHGQAADLRQRRVNALEAAKRAVQVCTEDSWPAAAAAAIAVVSRLQGSNPFAQPYHDVMSVLLDEAERGAHRMERAAAWLAAAPPLFPRLGLQLLMHFARLMPLLLGWCAAPRASVRAAALEALLEVMRMTWPRLPAHGQVIWRVLRRVYDEERRPRPLPSLESSQTSQLVADLAEDCGLVLWFAAGADFQAQLMSSKEGAKDDLLQAVMQRVEEAAAQQAAAEGQRDTVMAEVEAS